MGHNITLTSSDGHELDAYVSIPSGPSKAAIIIIQEIFGVNEHIKNLVNNFSARGYASIAPAMFDRAEKNISLSYTSKDIEIGRSYIEKINWEETPLDIRAAVSQMRVYGSVGLVGYCWGGTAAWLAATNDTGISCSVGYYGGRIIDFLNQKPSVPVMLHFGEKDKGIPMDAVNEIKNHQPQVSVHIYPEADHGFNCDLRSSYHADSAKLALKRTLEFFEENLE